MKQESAVDTNFSPVLVYSYAWGFQIIIHHLQFANSPFIRTAAGFYPNLCQTACELVTKLLPGLAKKPVPMTGHDWVNLYILLDLSRRFIDSPALEEFANNGLEDVLPVMKKIIGTREEVLISKEKTLPYIEGQLKAANESAQKSPDIQRYIRLSARFPDPYTGKVTEYGPFDGPVYIPDDLEPLLFEKYDLEPKTYHHSPLTGFFISVALHIVSVTLEMEDNVPAKIINAWFPQLAIAVSLLKLRNLDLEKARKDPRKFVEKMLKKSGKNQSPKKKIMLSDMDIAVIYASIDMMGRILSSSYYDLDSLHRDRHRESILFHHGPAALRPAKNETDDYRFILQSTSTMLANLNQELGDHPAIEDYRRFSEKVLWWE